MRNAIETALAVAAAFATAVAFEAPIAFEARTSLEALAEALAAVRVAAWPPRRAAQVVAGPVV